MTNGKDRTPSRQALPDGRFHAVIHALLMIMWNGSVRFWLRRNALIGVGLLWGFALVVAIVGWLRPVYGWDMIAYLAVAFEPDYPDPAALHARVWELVRNAVDAEQFSVLSSADSFRRHQYDNAVAFHSMLGMFEIKWLYVQAVSAAMVFVDTIRAPFLVNLVSLLGLIGVVCWWLVRTRLLAMVPIVIAFFLVAGLPATVLMQTPDLMTCAFVLAGFLFLDRDKTVAGGLALVAAVAVRPDSAAACGVLMAVAWYWRDTLWRPLVFVFAASVAVYVAISLTTNHPGWWPHLWFSTYRIQETMEGFSPDFSLRVYTIGFAWNLVRSAVENSWLGLYLGLLCAAVWFGAVSRSANRRRTVLVSSALVAVAAKFVIFPLHDGRTYLPLLLPAFLLLMAELRDGLARTIAVADGADPG